MKRRLFCLVLAGLLTIATLTGCSGKAAGIIDNESEETVITASLTAGTIPEISWPEEAVEGAAAEKDVSPDTYISCDGENVFTEGDGVSVEGKTITLSKALCYELKGNFTDCQIIVDTDEDDTVKLLLNGALITNSETSPVYVVNASKNVTIHLQKGSVNIIEDNSEKAEVTSEDEDSMSAALYSNEDIKISGAGSLYITSLYGKGIHTKDDLEIKNASIYVKAYNNGIQGKDSVTIEEAYVYVETYQDGIKTSNLEDKGDISISNSEVYIRANLDGIQSVADMTLADNTMVIVCGGGATGSTYKEGLDGSEEDSSSDNETEGEETTDESDSFFGGGFGGGFGGMEEGNQATKDLADSVKGIKATGSITIKSGNYTVESFDDAIHASTDLTIEGGSLYLATADDGIHADGRLTVDGGNIEVTESYEGLEGQYIIINGGTLRVTASDDGFNAAGGNDGSGTGGEWGKNDMFATEDAEIIINNGYIVVNASGDGLDSNGNMEVNGGTTVVYGPTNDGNGSLDYAGSLTTTGGILLAVGSSGMAQDAGDCANGQLAFTCSVGADTIMSIQDSEGNIIFTFAAPKSYSCVIFTSPEIKEGETYTVYTGGSYTEEAVDGILSDGAYSGGSELGSLSAK